MTQKNNSRKKYLANKSKELTISVGGGELTENQNESNKLERSKIRLINLLLEVNHCSAQVPCNLPAGDLEHGE